jgi:hypothetical protein
MRALAPTGFLYIPHEICAHLEVNPFFRAELHAEIAFGGTGVCIMDKVI